MPAVAAQAGPDRVAIASFLFGPEKLSVRNNQYVTWTNTDDSPHQVTIAAWQRLPLWATRLVGPRLVKYLP